MSGGRLAGRALPVPAPTTVVRGMGGLIVLSSSTHYEGTRKGCVLMIHGWAQNSNVMKSKTKGLTKKLRRAGYDCLFLEAPHVLPMTSTVNIDGTLVEIENGKRANARAWFLYSETDAADVTKAQTGEPLTYIGLQESIELIQNTLKEHTKPHDFVAALGFSQGAVMLHLLSALVNNNNNNDNQEEIPIFRIKCVILVGGFPATHTSTDEESSSLIGSLEGLEMPSLHVIGEADTSVAPEQSLLLRSKFHNPSTLFHKKGHMVPQQSVKCTSMINFLDCQYEVQTTP